MAVVLPFTRYFSYYSHMRIWFFIGFQQAPVFNGSRVDIVDILFNNICWGEFGVLLDFNKLRCEDNSLSFTFPKTLVRAAQ